MVRTLMTLIVAIVIIDTAFLGYITFGTPHAQQQSLSTLRIWVLIAVHGLIILAFVVSFELNTTMQMVALICVTSAIAVVIMTACLGIIYRLKLYYHYGEKNANGRFQNFQQIYKIVFNVFFCVGLAVLMGSCLYLVITWNNIKKKRQKQQEYYLQYIILKQFDHELEDGECPICLENIRNNAYDYAQMKVCGHMFHSRCLLHWLEIKQTCPICRKDMKLIEGTIENNDDS